MMTEKRADMIANRFHLVTTWISKNSADQRKGRTGRTLHGGICYRMCLEADYEKFESFRPLEIKRTPVADVVLSSCLVAWIQLESFLRLNHTNWRLQSEFYQNWLYYFTSDIC